MGIALVVTMHPVDGNRNGRRESRSCAKRTCRDCRRRSGQRKIPSACFSGAARRTPHRRRRPVWRRRLSRSPMIASLSRIAERSEGSAFLGLAILVERRQRLAESHCWTVFVLRALLLRSLDERRADIETRLAPIRAGELPIDVDRASGVLAAGRVGIGRDEAIDQRFHRRGLAGVEEEPRSFDEGRRRSRLRPPWQRLRAGIPCSRHEQERRAPEQLAPVKLQRRPSPEDTITLERGTLSGNAGSDWRRRRR